LLDRLTSSLDHTGAIEYLMSLLYYGVSATNAFDSLGHFARTEPQVGGCASYSQQPTAGCSANFAGALAAAASAGSVPAAKAPVTNKIAQVAWNSTARANKSQGSTINGLLDYLIGSRR
jgi:hypothetical protein